jgi:tetratricopeptide (TPR) repeat protein
MRLLTKLFGLLLKPFYAVIPIVRSLWSVGPVRAIQQFGRFLGFVFWSLVNWCASLNYRLLLQGLPAFAASVAALLVLAFALFTSADEIGSRYRERAQTMMRTKDYPEALVCYERLAHLQGDPPEILFEMARAAQLAGKPERCDQIMNQLAPLNDKDHVGLAKAHLWMARRLLAGETNPVRRQLAEAHLLMSIEGGVEDKGLAYGLLGEMYFAKGNLDDAERCFRNAMKDRPGVRLRLAVLYARQGKLAQSRDEAKSAVNILSNVAKANLFALEYRLQWAEAVTFLEDFQGAVDILREGLTTGEPIYNEALAQTYVAWFDHLSRQGAPMNQRLAMVEIGLRWNPKNFALLDRLLMVAGIHQYPQVSARQVTTAFGLIAAGAPPLDSITLWVASQEADSLEGARKLRELIASEPTSQLHFALGVYENQRQNFKPALLHFEQSHKMNPSVPTVANNLAWLLLHTSPDELPKALDLINTAIKLEPRDKNFNDTRGRIRYKMGVRKADAGDAVGANKEFRAALDDLEEAVPYTPIGPDLHRALADVYRRLDDPKMAEMHDALSGDTKTPKKKAGPR